MSKVTRLICPVFLLSSVVACDDSERPRGLSDRDDDGRDGGFGDEDEDTDDTDDTDADTDTDDREEPSDDDGDQLATLVFINQSSWQSFDWLALWDCDENLAYSYGFEIEGWLDPGETWRLNDVPTDHCFRPELWNDYFGVAFSSGRFVPGVNELTIVD